MQVSFSIRLPVDAHSVPLVRGLCRQALEHLHVSTPVIHDITLALTEACANVIQHTATDEEYAVHVDIDGDHCEISVVDAGDGFDVDQATATAPESILEGDRGLFLVRTLVDTLHFHHEADGRHRVVLSKRLTTEPPLPLVTPT